MTRILRKSWPYWLAMLAVYLLPGIPMVAARLGAAVSGLDITGLASVGLMGLNPTAALVITALFSYRHGAVWLFPVVAALLFLPAALLVYNSTAFVYAIGYLVFALLGLGLGLLLRRRRR